jgi:Coenzyme PQQ synthesis protein D (PqqD)
MQVVRTNSDALVENKLPDGSRVLLDPQGQRVFALNAAAGAAWDACEVPASLSAITEKMQHSLETPVAEEVAEEAILRLQEQQLVQVSGAVQAASSRRQFISRLGMAAVPLVVAMTMTEQRAYARVAQSFLGTDGPCDRLPCDSLPGDPFLGGIPPQNGNPFKSNPFGLAPTDPIWSEPTNPKGPQR